MGVYIYMKIRASALKTIVRGHSIPKGETRFPLQELVKLLAFEDENDVSARHRAPYEKIRLLLRTCIYV